MAAKELSDLTAEDYAKAKPAIIEALLVKAAREGTIMFDPTSIDTANNLIEANASILLFLTLTPDEERLIKNGHSHLALKADDFENANVIFRSLLSDEGLPTTDRDIISEALTQRHIELKRWESVSGAATAPEQEEESFTGNQRTPILRDLSPSQEPVTRWRKVTSAGGVIVDVAKDLAKTAGGLYAAVTTSAFESGAGYSLFAQDNLTKAIALGLAGGIGLLVGGTIGIAEIAGKENKTYIHEIFRDRYRTHLRKSSSRRRRTINT